MLEHLPHLPVHWAVTALSLWVSSLALRGIRLADHTALWVSALLLGVASSLVKPMIIVLSLPLTFLTFGTFLLGVNALMLLLVAKLVRGLSVSGFWTAFFASLLMALFGFLLDVFVLSAQAPPRLELPHTGIWL